MSEDSETERSGGHGDVVPPKNTRPACPFPSSLARTEHGQVQPNGYPETKLGVASNGGTLFLLDPLVTFIFSNTWNLVVVFNALTTESDFTKNQGLLCKLSPTARSTSLSSDINELAPGPQKRLRKIQLQPPSHPEEQHE